MNALTKAAAAPMVALLNDPNVCPEFKRALASSPALDRAVQAIEHYGATTLPRRRIVQLKAGARMLVHEPWRLDRVKADGPLMARLMAALAHRWFRRFA